MKQTIKGVIIGAAVASGVSILLAQAPWTAPRTWATDDLLTAGQFNQQFRDNLLNLRAFAACADSGITGTASADTVLFGDCRWDGVPTTTVVALDMGDTTTTATAYQTVGPTASLNVSTGQSVRVYVSGTFRRSAGFGLCRFRVVNTSTNTELFLFEAAPFLTITANMFLDSSPSPTVANVYEFQMRRFSSTAACRWVALVGTQPPFTGTGARQRGFIAVVT